MKLTKKNKAAIREARKFLKATGDPKNATIAKYLPQGMELFLQMLKAVGAASKIKLAPGIKVKHVDFETTEPVSTAADGTMQAAAWLGQAVSLKLAAAGLRSYKVPTPDPTLRPQEDPALAPFSWQKVPYFGSDTEDEHNERVKKA